jgi:chromosome segregation ATPase
MMSAWVYLVVGIAAVLGPVITAVVLLRKAGGETRKITVETVDVNVNIAGRLRDKAIEDWERIGSELDAIRTEFDQYKRDTDARMAELTTELRAERAEKQAVKRENDRLRERVSDLEAEVERLKSARP